MRSARRARGSREGYRRRRAGLRTISLARFPSYWPGWRSFKRAMRAPMQVTPSRDPGGDQRGERVGVEHGREVTRQDGALGGVLLDQVGAVGAARANSSASSRFLGLALDDGRGSRGRELGTAAVDPAIGRRRPGGRAGRRRSASSRALHRVLQFEAQLRLRERLITHLGLAVIDSSALAGGHFVDLLRGRPDRRKPARTNR